MKLKLKTLMAGPEGVRRVGEIIDVEPKAAKQFIDGGYAEPLEPVQKNEPDKPIGAGTGKIEGQAGAVNAPSDGLEAMKKADLISAIRQAVATA